MAKSMAKTIRQISFFIVILLNMIISKNKSLNILFEQLARFEEV